MPTTFAIVRDKQCTLLEAITPTKLAGTKFRRHREQGDFMAWVEASPDACLRRFQILDNFDRQTPETSDGGIQNWRHTMELRVAYPLELGLYGKENERDMDDFVDLDLALIDAAIGRHGLGDYVSGQEVCELQGTQLGIVPGAKVLSITYLVQYDRSV